MSNSVSNEPKIKVEKILVGITVQNNSRRLIKKGAEVAKEKNGQLHILNVQKGNNIFMNSYTPELLQELYQYGSELGGETHAICGENVCEAIIDFVKKSNVTVMVLGERPKSIKVDKDNDIIEKIKLEIPDIEVIILEREKQNLKESFSYKHRFA